MCPCPPAVLSTALDVPPVGPLSMFQTDTSSYPGNLLLLPCSCAVKGPAHLPNHWPLLPYPCSQYFPPLFSPFPFKVLNVPDLGYLKSLLNFLPPPASAHPSYAMAWLIFPRHCFVMPHSCSRISGGFPSFPESKAHVP